MADVRMLQVAQCFRVLMSHKLAPFSCSVKHLCAADPRSTPLLPACRVCSTVPQHSGVDRR